MKNSGKTLGIASIIATIVSLIVSITALIVSKETLVLTSQSYIPMITFEITNNGIVMQNRHSELYDIYTVSVARINTMGYWDDSRNGYVSVPFITESYIWGDGLYNTPIESEVFFEFTPDGPKSHHIFDPIKYQEIYSHIIKTYDGSHNLGYASPANFGEHYYIVLTYFNKFNEMKNLCICQSHIHGGGLLKRVISDEDYMEAISETNHPNYESITELMQYFSNRFFEKYE